MSGSWLAAVTVHISWGLLAIHTAAAAGWKIPEAEGLLAASYSSMLDEASHLIHT